MSQKRDALQKRDLLIVCNLRQNARETLTRMSRKTNIPISTIYDRLKHHERDLITRHTSLIDFAKLGYSTRAIVLLSVAREQRDALRDYLATHHSVNTLIKINDEYDYLAELICKQIRDIEEFMERTEERFRVKRKKVYYVTDEVKREGFLSDPKLVSML
ncbi:Lrp/AsnC family transcriptional regulator [Candidatus Woesearchaeota archaeon]|nr:Lrp/AsnC family transcriptional regulator [Candidatus Woesearchaeota archaeon]